VSQQNVELARRGIDALNRGGVEAVIELCDPEVEWIAIPGFLPDAEDFHGREGVRAWFEKVGDTLGEIEWDAEEIADCGDRLLVALRLRGSGRTSGIEAEMRIYQAWSIRNGRLVRLESYLTREEARKAAEL
jgi:ketosteroid isomerase-like protein